MQFARKFLPLLKIAWTAKYTNESLWRWTKLRPYVQLWMAIYMCAPMWIHDDEEG